MKVPNEKLGEISKTSKVVNLHIDSSSFRRGSTHLNTPIEVKCAWLFQDYKFSLISWEQEQYNTHTHREQPLASRPAERIHSVLGLGAQTYCIYSLCYMLVNAISLLSFGRSYYANVKYKHGDDYQKLYYRAHNNKCIIAASFHARSLFDGFIHYLFSLWEHVPDRASNVCVGKFSEHAASSYTGASFTHTIQGEWAMRKECSNLYNGGQSSFHWCGF